MSYGYLNISTIHILAHLKSTFVCPWTFIKSISSHYYYIIG
ncbi:MAG: hypothetical protein ACTSVY_01375 [Candidatus Helarchaeota archaeon]